jgi:hypothetical protein
LTPTLIVGRPLLGHRRSERELVFHLTRQLAYLRAGRILRVLWPHPPEIARLIEVAMSLSSTPARDLTPLASRIKATLPALALEEMASIGQSLRVSKMKSEEAALAWLRATDLTASRTALLLTGDLEPCAGYAESEVSVFGSTREERVLDLVAASVSEEMLAAREHLGLSEG